MAYIRTKMIKGNPYQYMQESHRIGSKVKTRHVRYIGLGGGGGGSGLGGVSGGQVAIKSDEKFLTEVTDKENFDSEDNEQLGTTKDNVVYGALYDKRTDKNIAKDMHTDDKPIFNDPEDWEKVGKDKSDLKGWDTTHIKEHREKFVEDYEKIEDNLQKTFPDAEYTGRIKTLPSMVKKLKKKNIDERFTEKQFQDIIGTRITFKDEKQLKKAVKEMKEKFKVIEEEDYISKAKAGYRSYHFTIEEKGKPIEVQFRTPNQTKWADWMHDRLYDNIERTKKLLGKKGFEETNQYAEEMSEYYSKLDKGIDAKKPKTPKIVEEKLGGGMENEV